MLPMGRMNAEQCGPVSRNLGVTVVLITAIASPGRASGERVETGSNHSTESLREMSPAERAYLARIINLEIPVSIAGIETPLATSTGGLQRAAS